MVHGTRKILSAQNLCQKSSNSSEFVFSFMNQIMRCGHRGGEPQSLPGTSAHLNPKKGNAAVTFPHCLCTGSTIQLPLAIFQVNLSLCTVHLGGRVMACGARDAPASIQPARNTKSSQTSARTHHTMATSLHEITCSTARRVACLTAVFTWMW